MIEPISWNEQKVGVVSITDPRAQHGLETSKELEP